LDKHVATEICHIASGLHGIGPVPRPGPHPPHILTDHFQVGYLCAELVVEMMSDGCGHGFQTFGLLQLQPLVLPISVLICVLSAVGYISEDTVGADWAIA
jgi:hypothetical protein